MYVDELPTENEQEDEEPAQNVSTELDEDIIALLDSSPQEAEELAAVGTEPQKVPPSGEEGGGEKVEERGVEPDIVELLGGLQQVQNEASAAEAVRRILEDSGYVVEPVSMRRGFRILLAEKGGRRYLIWVRLRPVDRKALSFVEKLVSPYEGIVERVLVKLSPRADYATVVGWRKIFVKR